jgi:hypothetical protein
MLFKESDADAVLKYLRKLAEPVREQVKLATAADLHDLGISQHKNVDDEKLLELAKPKVDYGKRDLFFHPLVVDVEGILLRACETAAYCCSLSLLSWIKGTAHSCYITAKDLDH